MTSTKRTKRSDASFSAEMAPDDKIATLKYKQKHIMMAQELGYPGYVADLIMKAETENEILMILKTTRGK